MEGTTISVIEKQFNSLVKDFQETIRELRTERAVMMLTLQEIAFGRSTDSGAKARETLARLEAFRNCDEKEGAENG